jgi:hypothetical protein
VAEDQDAILTRAAICRSLRAVTLIVALGVGSTLHAQGTMSEERCKAVMSIIVGTIHEYHGQISTDLIKDLQRKIGEEGKCDGPDEYRVWPNTKDREALGRIRQLISAWDICKKEPERKDCQ